MKTAKADFYDPKLRGKQDGIGMDDLPPIKPPQSSGPPPEQSAQVNRKSPNQQPTPVNQTQTVIKTPDDSTLARTQASSQAINQASAPASNHGSMLENIRRAIKKQGKEVAYVRLTPEEKERLNDIVYTYKRLGIKTTETEVSRIAINYLLQDHQANGKTSILACVLEIMQA